jgi:hypothetical protein
MDREVWGNPNNNSIRFIKYEVCQCDKPDREIRMVEGKDIWVKDVFCRNCDKSIYR